MQKAVLFLLAIIAGVLLYFGAKFIRSYLTRNYAIINITYDSHGRISIPMEVDGVLHIFQWDTGASASILPSADLEHHADSATVSVLSKKRDITMAISEVKTARVGDFEFESRFLILDSTCVIGENIINNFYWYFDFVKGVCEISKRPIKVDYNEQIKLVITIEKNRGIPICNIRFNEGLSARFHFDTGHEGGTIVGVDTSKTKPHISASLNTDIFITSCDTTSNAAIFFRDVASQDRNTEVEMGGGIKGAVLNGTSVNNLYMTLFLRCEEHIFYAEENKHGVVGYITSNFIKRFDIMYYNPFDNEIELYVHKDKLPQLLGEEIYQFIELAADAEYPFKIRQSDYGKYLPIND